ncbi:2-C-methyl-D-erythritol 4-phosphate cytidylyltransferase [Aquibacillus sp. 3ASR75-11]|uniref:2-C-methyl-D-erythritol 4-phosphate cytidylyltransferase n=1 Tax=Terrihalobacillus insolitus TaxID=2950438 RepID=A0A9X3WVT0_9BACI|nr:2-C-methyl-D-erythritol 4-phosphate cytidylyltransferase [Terrihalobacillus insolitus]MDC3425493.1 2-C-methyl-D-erythritol 4-phosphate cytidylyltransferase [Terrihalobacillus insolitus]
MEYRVIVLAAGEGKRMNAGENKQFIKIGHKPLILHTLDVFNKDKWCTSIVLVVNKREKDRMKSILKGFPLKKTLSLVEGGMERQESVFYGLKHINDDGSIVFIHDGARPFVSVDSLHELAEETSKTKAALLAVPVTDTIKQRKGSELNTLDRKTLWAAQTPQAFHYDIIYHAHKQAAETGFLGTDDASLVERTGHPVSIVKGSYDNIKLTTPEDLNRAQSYLKNK